MSAVMVETMTKQRNDKAVKISRDLAVKAKLIADVKGVSIAEYLSKLLRGPIEKDWPLATKKIEEQGREHED